MSFRQLQHIPPPSGDPIADGEQSPSSNSTTTRLTPDSDSDSDLELDDGELGESYKLQRRTKDVERAVGEDEEEDAPRRARRASSVKSFELYTPDEERAVVRKLDRRLVLFVALLYMLSFLDRSSKLLSVWQRS